MSWIDDYIKLEKKDNRTRIAVLIIVVVFYIYAIFYSLTGE